MPQNQKACGRCAHANFIMRLLVPYIAPLNSNRCNRFLNHDATQNVLPHAAHCYGAQQRRHGCQWCRCPLHCFTSLMAGSFQEDLSRYTILPSHHSLHHPLPLAISGATIPLWQCVSGRMSISLVWVTCLSFAGQAAASAHALSQPLIGSKRNQNCGQHVQSNI